MPWAALHCRASALFLLRPDPSSFPGTADPNCHDFMYCACVIGTSGQTADVAFNGSALRGMGLVHCVLSFFFNTPCWP